MLILRKVPHPHHSGYKKKLKIFSYLLRNEQIKQNENETNGDLQEDVQEMGLHVYVFIRII